jgi:hypothetical protein
MTAALVALLLAQDPQGQVVVPPRPQAQSQPASKPPAPLNLPADARRAVDQSIGALIEQLQAMRELLMQQGRPDDAAAVRAQIELLQKAAGLNDDTARRAERVSMVAYRGRIGETFEFTVTGSADFPVYGTLIYADDTAIEAAAVHAGVLRSGQTGPVRVTVLAGQKQYVGTRQHGIESISSGPALGSFRIETGSGSSSRPTSIANLRGRFGTTVTVPVIGSASGQVWGNEIYTDDSSLAAAAVHAGVLQPGEFGFVKVTLLGGQMSYPGIARNGIVSQTYAEWQGSFRVEAAPRPWVLDLPDDIVDGTGMFTLAAMRSYPGISFSVKVVGAAGAVRGTGIYTDDSAIGAAAVHAGVLKPGENGYVRVTVYGGQQSYTGSEQFGVKSGDAGPWAGSFTVERGAPPVRRR